MNSPDHYPTLANNTGSMSALSVSLTAMLAAVTHAYEFGPPAFAVGALLIGVLAGLNIGYRRTGNRVVLLLYVLLNLWIIVGFGMVGGFWNHAVKVALSAAHGGALPADAEGLFMSPETGSVAYETAGILTFVASLFAALFGYRFLRSARTDRTAME